MKFTFDETNYAQVLRRKALAEGKIEGVYMVAKNLLKKGISIDVISETTSLPKDKVIELSKSNI